MKPKISGAYTAIITPFNGKGEFDEEGLRKNIQFQIAHGIDGIVVLGTTGEAPTLTDAEKQLIISLARQETKGKCHFMVGTGSYSTKQAIENTREAQKLGADAVLVVTPYYNRPTQEGLYQHFFALAQAVEIPMVIYNIQSRTGQNLQTDTLVRLADIENIVGIKESSGSVAQMMEVIEQILPIRPDFSIMSGDDIFTYSLMALGGHGIFSVLGNLYPKEVKDLCDCLYQQDYNRARLLHFELLPLIRSLFLETNPIPLKAAMNLAGLPAGPCRLPLCEMSQENFEKLRKSIINFNAVAKT